MQDRYLSRGKRIDNGEWVKGNLIWSNDAEVGYEAIIIPTNDSNMYTKGGSRGDLGFENWHRVNETTICQCTAMPDKNSKLIFENDIVIKHNDDDKEPYLIRWSENYAVWELAQYGCAMYGFFDVDFGEIEVIGNAIDNPELLEV
ncbi:MAG: hypothetical protein KH160_13460 [Ruminococcus sp.]|nr:hypothetical protein [Ruminococcus sp.]